MVSWPPQSEEDRNQLTQHHTGFANLNPLGRTSCQRKEDKGDNAHKNGRSQSLIEVNAQALLLSIFSIYIGGEQEHAGCQADLLGAFSVVVSSTIVVLRAAGLFTQSATRWSAVIFILTAACTYSLTANILEGKALTVTGLLLTCGWVLLSRQFACYHQQPVQRHGLSRLEVVSPRRHDAATLVAGYSIRIPQARGKAWARSL